MSGEREIKTFVVGSATNKTNSGDYIVVSFSEQELEDDPFYKVVVVKNCALIKSKNFSLLEFDVANQYFTTCQIEFLGSVEKTLDFNEWATM